MDYNHKFLYQVQGQLEVADIDYCVFAIFKVADKDGGMSSIHEIEYESPIKTAE